jgi:hypothetical protein
VVVVLVEVVVVVITAARQCAYNVTLKRVRESLLCGKAHIGLCVHVGTRARGCVPAHKCM